MDVGIIYTMSEVGGGGEVHPNGKCNVVDMVGPVPACRSVCFKTRVLGGSKEKAQYLINVNVPLIQFLT